MAKVSKFLNHCAFNMRILDWKRLLIPMHFCIIIIFCFIKKVFFNCPYSLISLKLSASNFLLMLCLINTITMEDKTFSKPHLKFFSKLSKSFLCLWAMIDLTLIFFFSRFDRTKRFLNRPEKRLFTKTWFDSILKGSRIFSKNAKSPVLYSVKNRVFK